MMSKCLEEFLRVFVKDFLTNLLGKRICYHFFHYQHIFEPSEVRRQFSAVKVGTQTKMLLSP